MNINVTSWNWNGNASLKENYDMIIVGKEFISGQFGANTWVGPINQFRGNQGRVSSLQEDVCICLIKTVCSWMRN